MSQLKIEAGKIYLDTNGFLHGPLVRSEPYDGRSTFVASAVDRWWREDGTVGSGSPTALDLIAEWKPPTSDAAKDAEINRIQENRLKDLRTLCRAVGLFDGAQPKPPREVFDECIARAISHRDVVRLHASGNTVKDARLAELEAEIEKLKRGIDDMAMLHGEKAQEWEKSLSDLRNALAEPGDRPATFSACLKAIGKLKSERDASRKDCMHAERRAETMEVYYGIGLLCLCGEAGLDVPAEIARDHRAVYGMLVDRLRDMRADADAEFAEVAEKDPTDGGRLTPIYLPTVQIDHLSGSLSDLACWCRGYVAALPLDEFGGTPDREPMGLHAITEINIALDRAREKKS